MQTVRFGFAITIKNPLTLELSAHHRFIETFLEEEKRKGRMGGKDIKKGKKIREERRKEGNKILVLALKVFIILW